MGTLSFYIIKAVLLLIVLLLALFQDIRENRIKNAVTFPAALLGLAVNAIETGLEGAILSVQGFLIPMAALMVLYIVNGMGAGDIKLFAAIGSIMGLKFAACSFLFSVFAGGIMAVVLLIKKRALAERMKKVIRYIGLTVATRIIIPYSEKGDKSSKFIFSVAIVPGTCLQLLIMTLQLKGVTFDAGRIVWL